MGASFVNVQVLKRTQSSIDRLMEALIKSAESHGMIIAEKDRTESDRTIAIVPGRRWVSIYDEAAETESQEYVDALASLASTAMDSPAVSVQVYDSDICELRLFEGGQRADRYSSNPGYWFERELTAEEQAEAAGHPDRWAGLLLEGRTVSELAECWAEERTFAEETLSKTAELLGCEPDLMAVGYRYLIEEPLPRGAREVRFRLRERPSWESAAQRPPKFVDNSGLFPAFRFAVGDKLMLHLQTRNTGGEGIGIHAFAWGDALASELVEIEKFVLMIGSVKEKKNPLELRPARQPNAQEVVLQGDAPEIRIPAGIDSDFTGVESMKMWESMQRSSVHLAIVGRVVAPGKGKLALALSPFENHRDGSVGFATELTIDPPLYRPLHAPPTGPSHLLRALVEDNFLVGMIVFDAPRTQLVDTARSTFEQFAAKSRGVGKYEVVIYHRDRDRRPKSQKAKIEGFFSGSKWQTLRDAMCNEQQVQVSTEMTAPDFSIMPMGIPSRHVGGHGLVLGGGSLNIGTSDDPELPAACWWADVSNWSAERIADAVNLLMESMNAAMKSGLGVQAFLSRWGREVDRLESTPYEVACELSCETKMLRSWSTRWLRAVGTEATWIGQPLRAQLDRVCEASLQSHSDVSELGPALRICPQSRDMLPSLEQGLTSILPSQLDDREAREAYYARIRRFQYEQSEKIASLFRRNPTPPTD